MTSRCSKLSQATVLLVAAVVVQLVLMVRVEMWVGVIVIVAINWCFPKI